MGYLNVRIVDEDDDPVSGEEVTIYISHTFSPQTWLKDTTDEEGRAYFDFDGDGPVDVYVNGECQISGTESDGEVTVSI